MSTDAIAAVIQNPSDPEVFANWLGIDASDEGQEPEDVVADDDAPVEDVEGDTVEATETPEEDAAPEAEAEKPEPIVLPFEATANDEAVDTALLAAMTVTFKADGKEIAMPLADVVRRAQSEPAAQRQVRTVTQQRDEVQTAAKRLEAELTEVRDVAQRMARDPNFYAEVVQQLEDYDSPNARAERAERTLAEERAQKAQDAERQQFQSQVQTFAAEVVAPTLESIVTQNPLVSQEEILGKFFSDTAAITKNGVIPPEYHAQLADYLRGELAAFAADRQTKYATREQAAKDATRKTQVERQRLKNQTAGAAKPTALTGAPSANADRPSKPRTLQEASAGALAALIGS